MPSSKDPSSTVNVGSGPKPPTGLSQGLAAILLAHINDTIGAHPASAISYSGGGAWADGTTNPAGDIEVQLDKIISDLAPTTGARKLGVEAVTVSTVTNLAGTIYDRLAALQAATNIAYIVSGGPPPTWADGTPNPSIDVNSQLIKTITDLVNTASPNSGAHRVASSILSDGFSILGAGSIASQLLALIDANNHTFDGTVAWGGRTNPQASVDDQLIKVVGDLIATPVGDDGALRVGAAATGGIFGATGTVRSQLDILKDQGYMTGADWFQVPLGQPLVNVSNRWSFDSNLGIWVQTSIIDAGELWFNVPITMRGTINAIKVTLDGNAGPGAGNHAFPPGTMPTFTFYRSTGGVLTSLATFTDSSLTGVAYDTEHEIMLASFPPLTVDPRNLLYAKVTGETGANALVDELAILHIQYRIS